MAVDIIAYPTVTFILDCLERGEKRWCEEHSSAYAYAGFERTAEGWPGWDQPPVDGLIIGPCFKPTGESLRIMSTSYSGYNAWRRTLSLAVHHVEPEVIWHDPDRWADKPFVDLINFADNEGCIGHVSAGRLAAAFADEQHRAAYEQQVRADIEPEWYVSRYLDTWTDWLDGLRKVADGGGLVRFL
jgi:hypothetical protein